MAFSFRSRKKKEDEASLGPAKPKERKETFASRYNAFCYKLLGKRMESNGKDYEKLDEKLRQASMNMTPALYLARTYITGTVVAAISLVVYTIIFAMVMASPLWIVFVFVLTGVSAGATIMMFPFIVSSKISKKASQIEQELPFTLSELSIMASTGLSPVEIMRKIAQRNASEAVSSEFKKLVYKMDIEGKDLITAMSDTARETPSQSFRETLWDLSNMVHQGGDLDLYLRTKADDVMKTKRAKQKEFIEQLGTYSDVYITVVLIGVLFVGIGAFLMDAMNTNMMGFNGETVLQGMTFCILPIAIFLIALLVIMAYSRTE